MNFCSICAVPIEKRSDVNQDTPHNWTALFRALYIDDDNFDQVSISGVGASALNDQEYLVPLNPRKGWNQLSDLEIADGGRIAVEPVDFILGIGSGPESHWGFFFHDACWQLLLTEWQPDLKLLFNLCLSAPLGLDLILNFGHDYGGAAERGTDAELPNWHSTFKTPEEIPQMFLSNPWQIPALKKAIDFSARFQQDAFQSRLDPSTLSLHKDIFSLLPPELQERIVTLLPISDVHSLRLASPVFATLGLSERFWRSRFADGHEFEFVHEVVTNPPTSWRALYVSLHIWASDNAGLANRQRIRKIVKGLSSTLRQMKDDQCYGQPEWTWYEHAVGSEPEEPVDEDDGPWIKASREIRYDEEAFNSGSRPIRTRLLRFDQPLEVCQISVSFIHTQDGRFVSGMRLTNQHGLTTAIGYIHEKETVHITLPESQIIRGWELALDVTGVRAMAAVTMDGTVSSWAGNPEPFPRRLLVDVGGISALRAEFDAIKLVSLSRDRQTPGVQTDLRTTQIWRPHIPPEGVMFDGVEGQLPYGDIHRVIDVAFFKESGLTGVQSWIHEGFDVTRLDFFFGTESSSRSIGVIMDDVVDVFPPPLLTSMDLDLASSGSHMQLDNAGGEEINGLELQKYNGHITGLKVNTNRNRSELMSDSDVIMGDIEWTAVRPRGSKVVGM
ncbi:hypothetical protein FGRMN_932 [Fusarium graminum]|nr:hypothetical protein FGRMN_932 [Fusarium graminum]